MPNSMLNEGDYTFRTLPNLAQVLVDGELWVLHYAKPFLSSLCTAAGTLGSSWSVTQGKKQGCC